MSMNHRNIAELISEKINKSQAVLKALGLPKAQQNERSALILLAILDIKPDSSWSEAKNPLCGITPIIEFIAEYYHKQYAPNTRETIRRQTVHQFLQAGIITKNPDDPNRPINSPNTTYQIETSTLELLKTYNTDEWDRNLIDYLKSVETLKERYDQARNMSRIPVTFSDGTTISLSPGGQNELIKQIIEDFCSRFTPGGTVIYVGDAEDKWQIFDRDYFSTINVTINSHGKMPDIVVHYLEKNWLILIEAVTSHGPVSPKRKNELENVFKDSKAGLVFVTALLKRSDLSKYLNDISWETEVWVADSPTHLIHFNGERFLGPV